MSQFTDIVFLHVSFSILSLNKLRVQVLFSKVLHLNKYMH